MDKKKTIFIIAAIAFTILLSLLAIFILPKKKYTFPLDTDKLDILIVGDSLFCNDSGEKNLAETLAEVTGCEMQNCSIGGTCASNINANKEVDYYADMLGFYNISNMILSGNNAAVSDDVRNLSATFSDAYTKITFLMGTDLDKEDVLIVNYGINDAFLRIPTKSDDPFDEYTYSGAMRRGIKGISEKYPDLKIVIGEVTFTSLVLFGESDSYYDEITAQYRKEYNEELKKIASEFDNVYYFDFSSHVEINEENYGQYLIDGIHFNDEGKKIYADCLADYIGEIQ